MHLCYVDDSGDSKRGSSLPALIIQDRSWALTLEAWLAARRKIHQDFGVPKKKELHAVQLYKHRGRYCETREQDEAFNQPVRDAVGRIMLNSLAQMSPDTAPVVATMAGPTRTTPALYQHFLAWLDDWARRQDTYVMVFYDGQQAEMVPSGRGPTEVWESALRSATPYREQHRELKIGTRRVIEDVVMQDSRYNQLIQAADLIAYGAWHKDVQDNPHRWSNGLEPSPGAIKAYLKTRDLWVPEMTGGLIWVQASTQKPPAT